MIRFVGCSPFRPSWPQDLGVECPGNMIQLPWWRTLTPENIILVGGWTTHLKNMLVKLDHFPKPPPSIEWNRCLWFSWFSTICFQQVFMVFTFSSSDSKRASCNRDCKCSSSGISKPGSSDLSSHVVWSWRLDLDLILRIWRDRPVVLSDWDRFLYFIGSNFCGEPEIISLLVFVRLNVSLSGLFNWSH